MKYCIIAVLLILSTSGPAQAPAIEPGVSQELARWRAARYSDVRYKLNLTLEKMSPVLKGTIEIRVNVRDAGPAGRGYEANVSVPPAVAGGALTPAIILDWRKIRGSEHLSMISNVSINGTYAVPEGATFNERESPEIHGPRYRESNEHLIFADKVFPGENVIKLDFTSPILASGSAITRYVDKEDGSEYIYSLFVPSDASTTFPVFDQPDLKGKFRLLADVPPDWKIVSNTYVHKMSEFECPAGKICPVGYEFAETKPISTYVFAFAAGPFVKIDANGAVPPAVAGGVLPGERTSSESGKSRVGRPTDFSSTSKAPPATAGGTDRNPRSAEI